MPAAIQTQPTQLWTNLSTYYFLPKWQSNKHMDATWKRAGELQGGHRDTEESQGTVVGRAQRVHGGAWWYHSRHQGDTQGAGNAVPGVLGCNGSITGHG